MASSYTTNSGIEKPAEGDQTGEWGDTVNTNMDIIDRSINGVGAITLSGTTHTLTTTDGTLSDGMYKVLVLGGSPSGTNTITISPNDQDKVYIVVNGSGQTATFTQGSGANVSVLNGDSKIIYADGAGSGAAIVDVTADLSFSSVNIDGGTIDGTVIGGASAAAGTFTDVAVSGSGNRSVQITSTDGIGFMEVGSAAGSISLIDLKTPSSDDYDVRLQSQAAGAGGSLLIAGGTFLIGGSSESMATFADDGAVSLYYDNAVKLATASGGITVTGEVAATSLDISGDVDVDGTLETDALSIASTTVTSTAAELNLVDGSSAGSIVNSKAVIYSSAGVVNATDMTVSGSGARSITITSSDSIASMEIGSAASNAAFIDLKTPSSDDFDMRISSESGGSGGFLQVASGNLTLTGSGKTSAVFDGDGAVSLYHNNSVKIATASGGITVTGEVAATSLDISGDVDVDGTLETDALSIASTVVTSTAAELNILDGVTSTAAELNILDGVTSTAAELNILDGVTSTAAELNYLDITTLGTTQASKAVTTDSNGDVVFPDGDKINLGTGSDLVLQHDSANSYIQNNTGSLNIQGKSGENGIVLVPDGAVTLYHDNAAKLATTATGVDVTGAATASTFEPDSDTAAGDNAAIGYTAAEGLILTGQGSTSDVTIKNDADATVLSIPTGTTKVGIGTTAAAAGLHIESTGTEALRTLRLAYDGTYYANIAQAGAAGLYYRTYGGLPHIWEQGGAEKMRIHSDGKVGIGTAAPATKLHIVDSLSGGQLLVATSESDNAEKYGTFGTQHYDTDQEPVLAIAAQSAASENNVLIGGALGEFNAATSVKFFTAANATTTTGSERMRITSAGKVGIGTTAPGAMLQAHSAALSTTAGNSQDILQLHSPDTSNNTIYRFLNYRHSNGSSHDESELRWQRKVDVTDQGYIGLRNQAITFGYGTTERMRIINDGRIGIASAGLGAVQVAVVINGQDWFFVCDADDGTDKFRVASSGNVQNANNSYGAISDSKLKENIVDASNKLANLKQVKIRNFNFKGDSQKQIGVVAQELETIFPSMVENHKDLDKDGNDLGTTTKSVKYSVFVPMLIKAMQEQQTVIESLEARITALEAG